MRVFHAVQHGSVPWQPTGRGRKSPTVVQPDSWMLVHLLTRSRAVLWILMHPFRGKSGSRACGARWTGLRADDQTERERDSANCSLADATGSSADAVRVRSSSCVDCPQRWGGAVPPAKPI